MSELMGWVKQAWDARARNDNKQAAIAWAMVTALDPASADAKHNLGNALAALGRPFEAAQNFLDAIEIDPKRADSRVSLGSILLDLGQTANAKAIIDEALELDPASIQGAWNKSLVLLRQGDWQQGLRLFETRLLLERAMQPPVEAPLWDGLPFDGSLCVWAEQGIGDALHFARYLIPAAERVGKLTLIVHPELIGLLKHVFPAFEILPFGSPVTAERHVPLLSLAGLFGVFGPLPPYVQADPERIDAWRPRLDGSDFKIGFAWQGNPEHPADARRSYGLESLAPLLAFEGIRFISLQTNAEREPPPQVENFTHRLTDFSETAAVVSYLDLVITPDTALAHLCGAMNKPCWVGLRLGGDWRWGDAGKESPWYPSMKLFRQEQLHDWGTPMANMALALRALLAMREAL
ncbi:hypothetical protein MTBLM1_30051 [Rhodospirillaceae bacterium LM-1]|nr:hypothetical protein MTBLM1_30051 [Rhodospirillaceae bacterium LM-1]